MLNFAPMLEVNVMVLKEDVDRVTERLIELGLMQLLDIREVDESLSSLHKEAVEAEREKCAELKRHLERLAEQTGIVLSGPPERQKQGMSMLRLEEKISAWQEEISPLLQARQRLASAIKEKEGIYGEIKKLPAWEVKFSRRYSYIHISLYEIKTEHWEEFQREVSSLPHLLTSYYHDREKVRFMLVVLRKDREFLEVLAGKYMLNKVKAPAGNVVLLKREIEQEIKQLRQELEEKNRKIEAWRLKTGPEVNAAFQYLKKQQVFWQARQYFSHSDYVYFISGWVPEKKEKVLRRALHEICSRRIVYEVRPASAIAPVKAGRLKVPVMFAHSFLVAPFESLVKVYGVPAYGMIDPTAIVAVLFVLMFGAMFGDLGQGTVLMLAGLMLQHWKKGTLGKSGIIIAGAGLASAVFGLLYGSFFGFEDVFPAVWLRPLKNITYLFKLTVIFGIGVISAGIIINIINNLRFKDYRRLFFDKAGLISGVIYWAFLGWAAKLFAGATSPLLDACGLILVLALAVFLAERPLVKWAGGREVKREENNVAAYIFEKAMGIIEIFLGYLTNTLSFIRIAAFSLAHIGLFIAIFSLADIIKAAGGGGLASWLVIIGGNIFVILLEGLVVTIQALRLEYYEFFSRFFSRQGEEFRPLKVE